MKYVNLNLWISIFFSFLISIMYIFEKQYIFSLILFTFSLVFLTGFREFGKPATSYRIAHLYVGNILFLITGGYVFLTFIFSMINKIFGESIYKLTNADIVLMIFSLYNIYNAQKLRKLAFKK